MSIQTIMVKKKSALKSSDSNGARVRRILVRDYNVQELKAEVYIDSQVLLDCMA
jgi:hypothetical protein